MFDKFFFKIETWLSHYGKYVVLASWIFILAFHLSLACDELANSLGGDNAHYLMLALSLASGKGYRDLNLPGEPYHTHYPFLFPLFLSPFAKLKRQVFYSHIFIQLLASVIPLVALAWFRFLKRSRIESLMFYFFTATIPVYFYSSISILTEQLFILLMYIMLFLCLYYRKKKIDFYKVIILVVLLLGLYYTRTVGIVIGLAFVLGIFLEKDYRKKRIFYLPVPVWIGILFIIGVLPWQIWTKTVGTHTYLKEFFLKSPYNIDLGRIEPIDLLYRLKRNIKFYYPLLGDFINIARFGRKPEQIFSIIVYLISLVGIYVSIRKKQYHLPLIFVLYLLIILVWPFNEQRFIIPLYLIEAYFFLLGLEYILKFIPRLNTALILSMLFLIFSCWQGWNIGLVWKRYQKPLLQPSSPIEVKGYGKFSRPVIDLAKYPGYWSRPKIFLLTKIDLAILMNIAKETLPKDAVILTYNPRITWFYTRRKTVRMLFTLDEKKQWENVEKNGVNYVLVDPLQPRLYQFIFKNPERLQFVYGIWRTKSALFKLKPKESEPKQEQSHILNK